MEEGDRMRKYRVQKTKKVVTPVITQNKKNPKYFDIKYKKKKVHLTPAEKNWINFQIREHKREKEKAKNLKYPAAVRLIILMFILASLVFVYSELTSSFPETYNLILHNEKLDLLKLSDYYN